MSDDHRGQFFRINNLRFGKCLKPSMSCESKPIRAHSIQNARVIDLLEKDGHVISPQMKIVNTGPEVCFRRVGRRIASTFSGLCGHHDDALFKALDTRVFDRTDMEQLFLLAYRSVTRELHTVMEAGIKLQNGYKWRVTQGLDSSDSSSFAGMQATMHMFKAWETWQYRYDYFDSFIASADWCSLNHDVITLNQQPAVIAVSSLFSFANLQRGNELVRCVLNVVPSSPDTTEVIFSYAPDDTRLARQALDRILSSSGTYQRYELSKLILDRVENFLLSPDHFERWNTMKIKTIIDAFTPNIWSKQVIKDHPDLMLF